MTVDLARLRRLAEQARSGQPTWWLWDDQAPPSGVRGPMLSFAAAATPETVLALVEAVEAARELVRRDVTLAQVAINERVLVDALAPFTVALGEGDTHAA